MLHCIICLLKRKNRGAAVKAYKQALAVDPDLIDARYNLAMLYAKRSWNVFGSQVRIRKNSRNRPTNDACARSSAED